MGLTQLQRTIIAKARAVGGGTQGVALSDGACAFLVGVIARDLSLLKQFPELPKRVPKFFNSGSLESLDQLHGVVGVNVVVGGAIIDQQAAFEVLGVSHHGCFVVTLLIFLRKPHIALGVDRVVVAEISDGRGSARGAKNVGVAQEAKSRGGPPVGGAEDADPFFVYVAPFPKRLHAGGLVVNLDLAELQVNCIEEPFAAATGAA